MINPWHVALQSFVFAIGRTYAILLLTLPRGCPAKLRRRVRRRGVVRAAAMYYITDWDLAGHALTPTAGDDHAFAAAIAIHNLTVALLYCRHL
jgi:hypothetical protein